MSYLSNSSSNLIWKVTNDGAPGRTWPCFLARRANLLLGTGGLDVEAPASTLVLAEAVASTLVLVEAVASTLADVEAVDFWLKSEIIDPRIAKLEASNRPTVV